MLPSRAHWSTLGVEAVRSTVDRRLTGPDCGALTWQRPVVYPGSRVSARAPSALLHVAMTTTPGEAGRMLIPSLWTREPHLNKSRFNASHLTLHT